MSHFIPFCSATLCALSLATAAQAQSFHATADVWMQTVNPSGGIEGPETCNNGGTELCATSGGSGVYVGSGMTFENGHQVFLDFTYDEHEETNAYTPSRNDDARYHGLGLHYTMGSEHAPWGLFATWVDANNHADGDQGGPLYGLGAEKAWGNTSVQLGYMHMADDGLDRDHDGVEDMAYVNLSHSRALFKGEFTGNLAVGFGDFEESSDEDDGEWLQLGLRYQQPISDKLDWFVAYQGDFVRVGRTRIDEQATFNTLKFGLSLSLGNKKRSRFKTPNFRTPIVNAGEMNS